jgi:glycosyltransferase involved in cell wall biosynthesis
MASEPLVSICIPTYNGAEWVAEAIHSALEQTYGTFELLLVDDASADDTVEVARTFSDPRIRIEVNKANLGLVGNWNRCVRLARGEFLKFLFQDDVLYPPCLERMLRLFRSHDRIGLVFARRDILLENPVDPWSVWWKETFRTVHHQFETIGEINHGRDLFEQYLRKGFCGNWIGEPTSVMVRKECCHRLGLFNTRMHQDSDYEMWIRIMYFYDVGFLDEPLSAFRLHARSTGSVQSGNRQAWLDWMWLLEGLLRHEEIGRTYPQVKKLRRAVAIQLAKAEGRYLAQGRPRSPLYQARTLMAYLLYRLQRVFHTGPPIHG